MSHLPDDLRRYVSLLVRQYVEKRLGPMATDGPTTDSPVLDTDMLEENRLAWQQLAVGMRRTPYGDHPMLGADDDVTGDDWESLDVEDFLMAEADPSRLCLQTGRFPHNSRDNWCNNQKQHLSTNRQIPQLHRGSCRLNLLVGRQVQ